MTDEPAGLTIDELAQAAGMTVRNVRAHQARGLLPPPEVRARTGYYGPEHRARLELVKELQAEGVKLETIKRLLATTGGSTEQVLRFSRSVRQLFSEEHRQIVDLGELAERYGTNDPELVRRAEKLGLLRQVDEDQFEEQSPRLTHAGESLVTLGIPLDRALDVVSSLRRYADGVAKLYVELFLDEVWKPFDAAGRPADQWDRVHDAMGQLRAIAGDALLAVFELAMSERLDVTFGREITRNVKKTR